MKKEMYGKPALFETLVQTDEGGEGPCEAIGQEVSVCVHAETYNNTCRDLSLSSCQISDNCFSLERDLGHFNILIHDLWDSLVQGAADRENRNHFILNASACGSILPIL
jgi:hypothetical protein